MGSGNAPVGQLGTTNRRGCRFRSYSQNLRRPASNISRPTCLETKPGAPLPSISAAAVRGSYVLVATHKSTRGGIRSRWASSGFGIGVACATPTSPNASKSVEIDARIGRPGGTQRWSQNSTGLFGILVFRRFSRIFGIGAESPTLSAIGGRRERRTRVSCAAVASCSAISRCASQFQEHLLRPGHVGRYELFRTPGGAVKHCVCLG